MTWRLVACIGATATCIAIVQFASPASAQPPRAASNRLIVHEWGTFTSLHDENGNAIAGINADDEPVPKFVHRISNFLLLGPGASAPILYQGAPRCHPDVTMRLETPVVYFYPGQDAKLPMTLDVEVAFPSGWLSEYYPIAQVQAPGVKGAMRFGAITPRTVGRLRWNNLQVGTKADGPETSSHVWLAPRRVSAAGVTAANGESERYLFYRGVGHVDSPLRVSRDESGQRLILRAEFPLVAPSPETEFVVPKLWLVDIRANGQCAFREIDGFQIPNDGQPRVVAKPAARFDDAMYELDNIQKLRSAIYAGLTNDGLFPDEADALLNTWELSYFKSPGLRLFFLLPRAWTDHVLPMNLSVDAKLVRTMVGRVEIVSPQQRRLLGRIARGPASNASWLRSTQIGAASQPPTEPADYRAYRDLGRFRNALVLDELKRRTTPALQAFVDAYGLRSYRAAKIDSANADAND